MYLFIYSNVLPQQIPPQPFSLIENILLIEVARLYQNLLQKQNLTLVYFPQSDIFWKPVLCIQRFIQSLPPDSTHSSTGNKP